MAQASNAKVQNNGGSKSSNLFAGLTILFCIVIGFLVWQFIMGDGFSLPRRS
jgi:biopolymer transport protein ExbB